MMPHIISLLLIASLPLHTLGDETGSWGSLSSGPSESECRPYIEKALQQGGGAPEPPDEAKGTDDVGDTGQGGDSIAPSEVSDIESSEIPPDAEVADGEELQVEEVSKENEDSQSTEAEPLVETESIEESSKEAPAETENADQSTENVQLEDTNEEASSEVSVEAPTETTSNEEAEPEVSSKEESNIEVSEEDSVPQTETSPVEVSSAEEVGESTEESPADSEAEKEGSGEAEGSQEESIEIPTMNEESKEEEKDTKASEETASGEDAAAEESIEEQPAQEGDGSTEEESPSIEVADMPIKDESIEEESKLTETPGESEEEEKTSEPAEQIEESSETMSEEATDENAESVVGDHSVETKETEEKIPEEESQEKVKEAESEESDKNVEETPSETPTEDENLAPTEESATENIPEPEVQGDSEAIAEQVEEISEDSKEVNATEEVEESTEPPAPEEELSMIIEIPEKLRDREHMEQILRLSAENEEVERLLSKVGENTLRELKKLYDVAIKPLEILYKYRDLSNRHFGDPEIFSKPLILFMGPWSGGKSTIINYLLENEYKKTALRSGAEPSPAYFNIVMKGDHEEILDGTQLAADWTFSGLQKFGQGLLDRLRGLRLNHPLLEKVNIVEIPGILEIRKQVERLFPFNDACQWFIDRADIIFLVYDPSKLDVGPETEAILDQLKGREMQTRIILNKADQVKPEELMRVQGTLIWNISPLMSSTEPPVMYSTSLWSVPYEVGSPTRLLFAQERAFLKDLRDAIDKRVENKIASARRFAVRVRNHAKMVDCYLTTYYNHKSFFGNKKKISDDIIEHPQNYHIYEGLSTLTNISRYDLPDPDVYRDFFRLNPVYEFQQLSSTCTYFRGCPINRLDVAIAYDLPELVGKYKKQVEEVYSSIKK